jgi:glycosyltransferase involved in cell wall biosynthesis
MLNVGIYFETSAKLGGSHQQNLKLIDIFDKYSSKEFNFIYIFSDNNSKTFFKNKNINSIFFKKNFIHKLELFFFRFKFFQEFYKRLGCISEFEKFLMKRKINLIFFNTPSEISILLSKLNFIILLLSMQHRTHGFFPEYKGSHDSEIRDIIIEHAVKKSFKIFVGANKDKILLEKFFNLDSDKAVVQPYGFTLPTIYEKNKDYNFSKRYKDLNLPENKNIFIYPAQFWAHKNHKYIIDVAIELRRKQLNNIHFVFCGHDKGNKKYISKLIYEEKLNSFITILDFVDDFDLIALYLNCFGVVMPTVVGHTTIPMYESFYFKRNIFYTKDLCDDSVKKFLIEIDIKNPVSFIDQYIKIYNNKNSNELMLNEAHMFFKNMNIDALIAKNLYNSFKDYNFFRNMWE